MARSFAELRAAQSNVMEQMKQKFEAAKKSGARDNIVDDDTFWTLKHVKGPDGTGYAKIRFLPAPPDGNGGQEDDAFIRYYEYAFKGATGKWYINKSRMTLGSNESDPAYEYNGKIFGDETLTKEQRQKKLIQRNTHYVANILVEKDPNAPENEGKVFKFRYGPMIFNMCEAEMFPDPAVFPDKKGVNIFDPFEGASFNLRITNKQIPDSRTGNMITVSTYEKSSFSEPSSIVKDPADFDSIWEKQYSLKALIAESEFKSYEDLKREFDQAMNDKKSFLDTDEPLQKVSARKEEKVAKQKDLSEELNDEVPFVNDESENSVTSDSTFTDGDDDWFNSLKG